MLKKSSFNNDINNLIIDITGKRYSDYGMMWNELSILTGIPRSILERYDDWYILDNEFYFFKDRGIVEELFMSELANECKVRCVKFLLAHDNGNLGIISKLYREKNKEYLMYSDFCKKYFNNILTSLGGFRLSTSIQFGEDKMTKIMNDLFDLISFDIFSGQWDRDEYNFFFECDKYDNIRIAPLCDNGAVFQKELFNIFPFGEFCLDEDRIFDGNLPCILSCEKYFYNKLASMLEINILDILNRTCDKYKISIDDEDKKRLLSYFDGRKNAIDKTLKLVK